MKETTAPKLRQHPERGRFFPGSGGVLDNFRKAVLPIGVDTLIRPKAF